MLPVVSVIPDAPGIGFLWIFFSLRPPFLSGDLGSWQEVAYMLPKLGVETETSLVTQIQRTNVNMLWGWETEDEPRVSASFSSHQGQRG